MRKQILNLVLIAVFLIVSLGTKAQLSITNLNTNFVIDFENTVNGVNNGTYAGTGFALTPDPGQLDANAWEIIGMSDGLKYFGDEQTTGDFARGTSLTSNTGGLYSYEVATGDWALGIQPAGSGPDMTNNAYIALKVQNNTGTDINQIKFDYDVWVYNSQNRSQIFNGEYSLDGTTWIAVTELNFETPLAQDATPVWLSTAFTATIIEDIADGDFIYFRWFTKDNGGSGSRDKIAIDNISVNMDYDPCPAANIPFFEGFENGFTHNTTVENCWTQEALAGTNPWTANKTLTDYNRTPRTGEYNAFLRYSNTRWLFYPVNLEADENYDFTVWARQDASSGAKLTLAWGLEGNASAMTNIIVDEQAIISGDYQEVKGTFSVPTDGTYYIGIKGTLNSSPWHLSIDDISLDFGPTCVAPENIQASNITSDATTITWDASITSVAAYNVYSSDVNTAPADDIANSEYTEVSGVTTTLGGLTPNTTYYVWVRSDCSASDMSSWGGPVEFTTSCAPDNIPYYQDFESVTAGNIPECTKVVQAGTGNMWTTESAPGYGFTNMCLKYGYSYSNAANSWYFTNGLNLQEGVSYRLTYKYGTSSTSSVEKLKVTYGTSASPSDVIATIVDNPNISNNVAAIQVIDFTPTTSGIYYIGFNVYSAANQYRLFIDDISIELSPSCIEPTDLAVDNFTANSANISWTVSVSNPGSYHVYYSTSNIEPADDITSGYETTNTNSIELSNLESNTTYYVWVRSNCDGTDFSFWAGPVEVTTPMVVTSPWSEGFASSATPAGWTTDAMSLSNNSSAINSGDGSTTYYMYKNLHSTTYSTGNFSTVLVGPISGTEDFSFDYKIANFYSPYAPPASGTGNFVLEISTDFGNTWTQMDSVDNNAIAGWQNKSYPISTYAGAGDYVKFRVTVQWITSGGDYCMAFDNFNIASCMPVAALSATDLTANSANISWTVSVSNPGSYHVYYSTSNIEPADDITSGYETTNTNSIELSNLESNTTYYVWVRSNCGGTDFSVWAGPVEVTTPMVVTPPWSEGFASSATPAGWTTSSMSLNNSNSAITNGGASGYFMYKNLYSSATTGNFSTVLVGPISGTEDFSFDYKIANFYSPYAPPASGTGNFVLEISTDFGNTWTQMDSVDNNAIAGWQNKSYPISTYAIAGDYVKFRITANWLTGGGDYCIGFDNFNLASCFPISGLSVANIEENSATISWTASTSNPASYQVYCSINNTAPAEDETNVETTPENTIDLSGLSETTQYYVWVRSDCGASDFSAWGEPLEFTTLCYPADVPFFEGFEEGYVHNTAVAGCWTQESVSGSQSWVVNSTNTTNNRTPRTGLFNATLQYSNEDWLFYKVNLIQGESYDFSVWARQDETSGATLTLAWGTEDNSAAMTNIIVDAQVITNGDYQEVKGTFSVPTDGTYYIGIKGTLNSSPWYLSIDDISLKYTPTCFQPTNIVASDITTNSATISWTASSSNPDADYHVYYSNLNVAPADDIELAECEATTTNSIALSDLTDAEIYYVWVRSDCGGGDYSYWTGPITFTTLCEPEDIPYYQDFEGGFTIPCWSFVDNHASVSSNWHVVSDGNPGNGLVVDYTDNNMMDEWAISPTFDLTGITESVILSFDFYMDYYYQVNPYDGADLMVKVSTDDGSTWTQIWREEDFGVFDSYEWYSVNLPFDTYLGQSNVKFAFHYLGDDGNYLAIDNVRLDYAPSSEAEILTYTIPNQVGETTIDPAGQTVELTVPYAMEVTDLVATFTLSDGASAKIGTVDQESGVTGNNFTNPVTYTVTAEDGVTFKDWTVTVNLAPVSTEAEILTYSLPNQVGEAEINSGATEGTITVTMPYDTEVANLVANFTLSYGATAKVGAIDQETGVTPNNFTDPVVYAVTAQDGSTIKNWTVTVNLEDAPSSEANILTYSFAEQYSPAVIDDVNHTVTVVVNEGTSLDALVATFTLSPGASAKIGAVDQESGVTENNFTDPVIYTVTAEDGTTTQPWTVTVSVYVGIEDVENSALAIYPNPNNGNFTLDFTNINGKVNYQIYDTKGSIIISDDFVANGSAIKEVSLNLVPGVYFVKLITENQSLIEKLIIE